MKVTEIFEEARKLKKNDIESFRLCIGDWEYSDWELKILDRIEYIQDRNFLIDNENDFFNNEASSFYKNFLEEDLTHSKLVLNIVDKYIESMLGSDLFSFNTYNFVFGTLIGRFDLKYKDKIGVFAIKNNSPGNGDFIRFVEMIEEVARKNKLKIDFMHVINSGLFNWLKKRGYVKRSDSMVLDLS